MCDCDGEDTWNDPPDDCDCTHEGSGMDQDDCEDDDEDRDDRADLLYDNQLVRACEDAEYPDEVTP